ncbi:C10 family peptidase [Mucilaginibacter sp. L196]|uniref:C10 family peptidase n=1 Tax=Mucilaginibacter sp. L196 TaxID=1641870 RepID=UPI00131C3861|nr:C10 family peptidase [Mucilaginibacter sp. L196]
MQLVRNNTKLKVPPAVAEYWSELKVKTSSTTNSKSVDNVPAVTCQPTNSDYIVGPLLQTAWAQGEPYNYLCPIGQYSAGHTPTGCVATAMAQVMYYWKYPSNYNWNIMPIVSNFEPINYPGNQDVAQLMLDIGYSVDMQYNDNGSNPVDGFLDPPISCTTALKNTFHYSSSSEGSYDENKVQVNLNAGQPVLLSASTDNHPFLYWNWGDDGHEWVCDGYNESSFTYCMYGPTGPEYGESFVTLHMNWGWNEAGEPSDVDGWYNINDWTVQNGDITEVFQYNAAMTYNIHP